MGTFEVVGRTGTTIRIPIGRGKALQVTLVDAAGRPLARVPLRFHVGDATHEVETGPDGVGRLTGQSADAARVGVGGLGRLRDALAAAAAGPGGAAPAGALDREVEAFEQVDVTAAAPVTVRVRAGLRCLELAGPHFGFDRAFVRPDGMATLKSVVAELDGGPARRAIIYGHTDTVGTDDYNKRLSERRARAVFAALTHDAAAWEELQAAETWGSKPVQVMLNTVNDGSQPTSPEDGNASPAFTDAVRAFQKRKDHATLEVDGKVGPATRRELFLLYFRKHVPTPAAADRFRAFGAARFMGCGEFNPFTPEGTDELSRRVVVLVHEPAAEPPPLPCAIGNVAPCRANLSPGPAGSPTPHFRCQVYRDLATRCPCGQSGEGEAVIAFVDEVTGTPYKHRQILIEHADGRRVVHETNAEGKVVISGGKAGGYKIIEVMSLAAAARCRVAPAGG